MNKTIYVVPEKLKVEAAKIKQVRNKFQGHLAVARGQSKELEAAWQGDAAYEYQTRLSELNYKLDKIVELLTLYSDSLNQMAEGYEEAERLAKEATDF